MKKILILTIIMTILFGCSTTKIKHNKSKANEQIGKLVKALNSANFENFEKELSEEYRVPGIPESMSKSVISQVISSYGKKVDSYTIISEEKGELTTVIAEFQSDEDSREFDFLFDKEYKFVEINIFQTQVQKKMEITDKNFVVPEYMIQEFSMVNNLMVVEAEVDGKMGKFLVDSGAPTLVLNSKYFATEKLDSVGAQGVSGNVTGASFKRIKNFKWNQFEYNDIDVYSMELSHLNEATGIEIMGLISYEELKHFEILLNYKINQMVLTKVGTNVQMQLPYKLKAEIKFEQKSHIPIFSAEINGKPYRLGLDTGAETNLLDSSKFKELKNNISDLTEDSLVGANKEAVVVRTGKLDVYSISGNDFANENFVFSDISHLNQGYGLDIDGLIGYQFLHKNPVSINYKEKVLKIYE